MKDTRIIAVGSGNTEEVVVLDQELDFSTKTSNYQESRRSIGGSAVNWSVWLREAGVPTHSMFPYGKDEGGKQLAKALAGRGIDSIQPPRDTVGTDGETVTSHSYVLTTPALRKIVTKKGTAVKTWTRTLVDDLQTRLQHHSNVKILMLGNIPVNNSPYESRKLTMRLLSMVSKRDGGTFVYANFGSHQRHNSKSQWGEEWGTFGCLQFSVEEAVEFVELSLEDDRNDRPPRLMDWVTHSRRLRLAEIVDWFLWQKTNAAITLGQGGAVGVFHKLGGSIIIAWPNEPSPIGNGGKVVDPTGAGDAFGAGFCAYLSKAIANGVVDPLGDIEHCRLAMASGSRFGFTACTGYGGIGGCRPTDNLQSVVGNKADLDIETYTKFTHRKYASGILYSLDRHQ